MPKRPPKAFVQAVATHRNRLQNLITKKAASSMKAVYDDAHSQLTGHLARAIRAGKGDTFSAHQMRVASVQLRQGQALIAQRMAGKMGPLSKQAQQTALSGLVNDVSRLSKAFTGSEMTLPVDEAARFAGVVDKRRSSLMRMHQNSMARHGASVVKKAEHQMAVSLLTQQDSATTIDQISSMIGGEWWQAERIVRTEMAFAFNAAHYDGVKESADELPELMQRWEEHCDDDGSPLDDRVAVDSIAMHGQVTEAGGLFTMPLTAPFPDAKGNFRVPRHLVGEQWPFPPNRPNDRSVLSPWMASWGVPGWRYEGGRRKTVTETETPSMEIKTSQLEFQRDGMRDMSIFRENYQRAARAGLTPTEFASQGKYGSQTLPIRINIEADGTQTLADGRHRLTAAREAGAESILARVVRYDEAGNIVSDVTEALPIGD